MRTLREVVRLKVEMKLSGRAIARSCSLSPATVSDYLGRIEVAKLGWPLPPELDDDEALTRRLFPQQSGRSHIHRALAQEEHSGVRLKRARC